jgi:hypothetical protein
MSNAADRIARPDWRHRRAADRARHCKDRKRAGLAVLHVEVELAALADQLVVDRFLPQWDSEDRMAIQQALQRMLAIYILGANALPNPTDR